MLALPLGLMGQGVLGAQQSGAERQRGGGQGPAARLGGVAEGYRPDPRNGVPQIRGLGGEVGPPSTQQQPGTQALRNPAGRDPEPESSTVTESTGRSVRGSRTHGPR